MVSNDDIERLGAGANLHQCLPAVRGPGQFRGWTTKDHRDHVGEIIFVFDNQDPQALAHEYGD